LDIKTVNDKVSAQSLATMGLEKKLDSWKRPSALYNHIRQLTRERDQLIQERTQTKCQLHAETSGAWPNQASIKRMKQRIKIINAQKADIESEIMKLVESNEELNRKVKYVCTIKGVALITAATVIAETNGFNLIRNKQQLVSYAGLDVKEHTSGTSVHKKARISHHGNKYLRKCLHFPALTAIRHSKNQKELFVRLVSKHGIKMKAAVAVQRKILILIYTLWKNETIFDPEYEIKKSRNELGQSRKTALMELA
jgi:transposase